jgi:hypothetical protein
MKKIFFFAAIAVSVVSCNNNSTGDATISSDDTASLQTPPADHTHADMDVTATYQAEEGDVKWQNEKLLVYKNGNWVEAEKDMTLDDGTVITVKGDARKEGKTITLKEGESVKKTGRFFDKAGKAISNAWDATKEGVKNAGEAVKEGAQDAGKAVKEGVDKAGKKTKKLVDSVKN